MARSFGCYYRDRAITETSVLYTRWTRALKRSPVMKQRRKRRYAQMLAWGRRTLAPLSMLTAPWPLRNWWQRFAAISPRRNGTGRSGSPGAKVVTAKELLEQGGSSVSFRWPPSTSPALTESGSETNLNITSGLPLLSGESEGGEPGPVHEGGN